MLEQLKREFRGLKVVDCGLWHEQVIRVDGTLEPVPAVLADDVPYQRPALCDRDVREQLGCAHTALRLRAVKMVEDIGVALVKMAGSKTVESKARELVENYRAGLAALEIEIIQTDRDKSDLELEHAVLCDKQPAAVLERQEVEARIAKVKQRQKVCNEKIRALQSETLRAIEAIEVDVS